MKKEELKGKIDALKDGAGETLGNLWRHKELVATTAVSGLILAACDVAGKLGSENGKAVNLKEFTDGGGGRVEWVMPKDAAADPVFADLLNQAKAISGKGNDCDPRVLILNADNKALNQADLLCKFGSNGERTELVTRGQVSQTSEKINSELTVLPVIDQYGNVVAQELTYTTPGDPTPKGYMLIYPDGKAKMINAGQTTTVAADLRSYVEDGDMVSTILSMDPGLKVAQAAIEKTATPTVTMTPTRAETPTETLTPVPIFTATLTPTPTFTPTETLRPVNKEVQQYPGIVASDAMLLEGQATIKPENAQYHHDKIFAALYNFGEQFEPEDPSFINQMRALGIKSADDYVAAANAGKVDMVPLPVKFPAYPYDLMYEKTAKGVDLTDISIKVLRRDQLGMDGYPKVLDGSNPAVMIGGGFQQEVFFNLVPGGKNGKQMLEIVFVSYANGPQDYPGWEEGAIDPYDPYHTKPADYNVSVANEMVLRLEVLFGGALPDPLYYASSWNRYLTSPSSAHVPLDYLKQLEAEHSLFKPNQ